jgi:integrase/recombinase XerD
LDIEQGLDIRLIQAVLGHRKPDTTARYTRVATGRTAAIQSPAGKIEVPLLKKLRQKR